MHNKNIIILTICFSIICYSCGFIDGNQEKIKQVVKVKVQNITKVKFEESIAYSGTVEPEINMPLSFLVGGTVEKVLFEEGDKVTIGSTLATINNQSYKDSYDLNNATFRRAEDAYLRMKSMYEKGNISEIKFVEIETAYKQAYSSLSLFKKNLDDCFLISPINGIVGKKTMKAGMNVAPGIQSISIININKVKILVPIPENEIDKIKIGQIAKIKIAALNNTRYTGEIDKIGIIAHPFSHTYEIEILIENKKQKIKPGMVCSVNIKTDINNFKIAIPGRAISIDEFGAKYVYVIDNKRSVAFKRVIETGKILKDKIEVISGLNEGDNVIVSGQQKLSNNTFIEII